MSRWRSGALVAAFYVATGCDGASVPVPAAIDLRPDSLLLALGIPRATSVQLLDPSGAPVMAPVTYRSSDTTMLIVSATGVLDGRATGIAYVHATAGSLHDSSRVDVWNPSLPTSVALPSDSVEVERAETAIHRADVRNREGQPIGVPVGYTSSDTAVFTVAGNGLITGRSAGKAWLHAVAGGHGDSARIVVTVFAGESGPPIALAGLPYGLAISTQRVLYVTQADSAVVARRALPGATAVPRVAVGAKPVDVIVSADGNTMYTANLDAGTVSVFDVPGDSLRRTFTVAEALRVLLSRDETRLYVSQGGSANGRVRVINAATGAVVANISVPNSFELNGLALSADGSRLYASGVAGFIAEIHTGSHQILRTLSVGGRLQALRLSPDDQTLYVIDEQSARLKVVSVASGQVTTSVPLGVSEPFDLVMTADGRYLVAGGFNGVCIMSRRRLEVVRTFPIGGRNRRMGFDADGALYVANETGGIGVIR